MNPNTAGIVPSENHHAPASSHDVRSEAISFLRGHKITLAKKDVPENIPLRTPDSLQSVLLLHPRYRSQSDTVALAALAKDYVKGRLPVASREIAVALLLSRDEHNAFLKKYQLAPLAEPLPLEEDGEWEVEVEVEHSPKHHASLPTIPSGKRKFR